MSDLKIVFDATDDAEAILIAVEKYINCEEEGLDKDAILEMINSKMNLAFDKGRNFQMLIDEGRKNLQNKSLSIDSGLTEK